jgi:CheY-like chemotaxis protein
MQPPDIGERAFARVLVVDDDTALTQTLARVLSGPKVEVDVANDALAGLALVREHCPELVIVDLHMPEMDGVQFIDECRTIPECGDVPVLLTTGDDDIPGMRTRLEGKGVVLIVPKPFDLDMLMAAVSRAVGPQGQA